MKQFLVRSPVSDSTNVPLDMLSSFLKSYTVSFAIRYTSKSAQDKLISTLEKILIPFKVLAGRLIRTEAGLVVCCNNTGVPLSFETHTGNAPNFMIPVPASLFDLATNCNPQGDAPGEAPLKIRVTDFDDCQIIAVSICHSICDAVGFDSFLSAWAEAYRGGLWCHDVSHERIATPPVPSKTDSVPKEWRKLKHLPEDFPSMPEGPLESPVFISVRRSPENIAKLKA